MQNNQSKNRANEAYPQSEQERTDDSGVAARAGVEAPVLAGVKPVAELLDREPGRVDAVFIHKGRRSRESDAIIDLCRRHNVRFQLAEPAVLDKLYRGQHQGVVARLFEAGFMEFDDLLRETLSAPLPLLVALDQVQDPGNAGTLARTLYALGGAGLIIPKHNGAYLGAGARRAAAGALERLPVARVTNLSRALDEAEEAGFHIYGAALGAESQNAFTTTLYTPAVLVLGNEDHGLRQQVAKRCQTLLHIPMARDFDSLNVAQAGAILVGRFAAEAGRR